MKKNFMSLILLLSFSWFSFAYTIPIQDCYTENDINNIRNNMVWIWISESQVSPIIQGLNRCSKWTSSIEDWNLQCQNNCQYLQDSLWSKWINQWVIGNAIASCVQDCINNYSNLNQINADTNTSTNYTYDYDYSSPVKKTSCSKYGQNSIATGNWMCTCIEGYTMWDVYGESFCIPFKDWVKNECKNQLWNNSSWEIQIKDNNQLYRCLCEEWYILSNVNWKKSCTLEEKNIDTFSNELKDSVTRMYAIWLTSKFNIEDFKPNEYLTREQASKFFVEFAKKVKWKTNEKVKKVFFKDTKMADPTLKSYIIESNQMWIINWSKWNFMPFDNLKKSQALAMLIRIIYWSVNENRNPWYIWYQELAKDTYWIIDNYWVWLDLDIINITRWDMALLFYRVKDKVNK